MVMMFHQKNNAMDPSGIIASGVSTVGNLLGGLFGSNISYKNQSKLMAQQYDYNRKLLQSQMDYNNPKNQMAMYREAGVNPYAALGSPTSVTGSSVGLGSAAAPNFGNLGSDAVRAYNDTAMLQTNKDRQISEAQRNIADSLEAMQRIKRLVEDTRGLKLHNDFEQFAQRDLLLKVKYQNQLIWSEIARNETSAMMNELLGTKQLIENRNLQKIIDTDLAYQIAYTKTLVAQRQQSYAEAAHAIAGAALLKAQTVGVGLSNKLAYRMADDIVEKFRKESTLLDKDIDWYGWNHTSDFISDGLGFLSNLRKPKSVHSTTVNVNNKIPQSQVRDAIDKVKGKGKGRR